MNVMKEIRCRFIEYRLNIKVKGRIKKTEKENES